MQFINFPTFSGKHKQAQRIHEDSSQIFVEDILM